MIVVPLIILKHSREKDRYSLLLLGPRTGKKTTRLKSETPFTRYVYHKSDAYANIYIYIIYIYMCVYVLLSGLS